MQLQVPNERQFSLGKKMEEMNGTLVVCKKKHMDDPLIQQGRPSSAMGHLVQLASGGGDHW